MFHVKTGRTLMKLVPYHRELELIFHRVQKKKKQNIIMSCITELFILFKLNNKNLLDTH